jgi:hypothetical protein
MSWKGSSMESIRCSSRAMRSTCPCRTCGSSDAAASCSPTCHHGPSNAEGVDLASSSAPSGEPAVPMGTWTKLRSACAPWHSSAGSTAACGVGWARERSLVVRGSKRAGELQAAGGLGRAADRAARAPRQQRSPLAEQRPARVGCTPRRCGGTRRRPAARARLGSAAGCMRRGRGQPAGRRLRGRPWGSRKSCGSGKAAQSGSRVSNVLVSPGAGGVVLCWRATLSQICEGAGRTLACASARQPRRQPPNSKFSA